MTFKHIISLRLLNLRRNNNKKIYEKEREQCEAIYFGDKI